MNDRYSLKFKCNCIVCNNEFLSRVTTAKFCSSKCKTRNHRKKKIEQDTKIYEFHCPECTKGFGDYVSLRKHRSKTHKVSSEQTYIEFKLNGEIPLCKCGCGEKVKFLGDESGFRDYKVGHVSRVEGKNNWGNNPNFDEIKKKSAETQKKMYESGELKVWNDGLTKETDERVKLLGENLKGREITWSDKISESQKLAWMNEDRREQARITSTEYWSDPKKREEQRFKRIKWLKENQFKGQSNLEKYFGELLTLMEIVFEGQYELDGYLFDYYIPEYNILIEVDGDWYHCNPNVHPEAKSVIQEQVVKNDIKKNKVCEEHNIKLLRFWENDINNNKIQVMERLLKELK
ncbi:hypothetical protein COB55_04395 [Candidatus Wolfebacteria bacterium]|nr:MAG: hypothetical protein COB55_04395 [Candidatus Wolfebacteria bacterium]